MRSALFALHTDFLTECDQSPLKCNWSVLPGLQTRNHLRITSLAYRFCIHMHDCQCCSRVTMPRVRVQARVSSVRVRVKSKSLKKNLSQVRVESTTHTSQVRVESLLIHIESESSPSPSRVRVITKAYMLLLGWPSMSCWKGGHLSPGGGGGARRSGFS